MNSTPYQELLPAETQLMRVLRYLPRVNIDGPWVAGEAICRTIVGQDLHQGNIDFFFRTMEQYEFMLHRLNHLPKVKIIEEAKKKNPKYGVHEALVEIDIGHNLRATEVINLQLIYFKYHINLDVLLNTFDFTACQFGFDGTSIIHGKESLKDLKSREIRINNITHAEFSMRHLRRYLSNGYTISKEQMMRFLELSEIDLEYKSDRKAKRLGTFEEDPVGTIIRETAPVTTYLGQAATIPVTGYPDGTTETTPPITDFVYTRTRTTPVEQRIYPPYNDHNAVVTEQNNIQQEERQ
jgi:hypothetical protein